MKYIQIAAIASSFALLYGCGQQTAKSDDGARLNDDANKAHALQYDMQNNSEAQLIRELHNSGCVIVEFALDRRKQNMHVSCANDMSASSPAI